MHMVRAWCVVRSRVRGKRRREVWAQGCRASMESGAVEWSLCKLTSTLLALGGSCPWDCSEVMWSVPLRFPSFCALRCDRLCPYSFCG